MSYPDEHPEIRKARLALEEVSKKIRAYEAEKYRLEEESKLPGVKGLAATNLLAQLEAGPLAESLRAALITAEAAVRIASKKFGGSAYGGGGGTSSGNLTGSGTESMSSMPTDGAIWWMNRDLEEKKKRYGKKEKK